MAITLGTLRTFCQEIAGPDMSGSTADREHMIWIRSAVRRVYSELSWDRITWEEKLTVLPSETGVALTCTQGSLALVLTGAETFKTKYVDDEWELHVDGEGTQTFRIASIDDDPTNQNATMRAGDEWIDATSTDNTYYWVKTKYTLPNTAKRIQRVQILDTQNHVVQLSPQAFDSQRSFDATQRGSYPRFFTLRKNKIEIWPHPGTSYTKLGVSYTKGPPTYADTDADTVEIDWDEEWEDLLQRAIVVEAALTLGDDAPINFQTAMIAWEDRLNRYKGLDANKGEQTGPMGLRLPYRKRRDSVSFTWSGPLTDE